MTHTKLPTGELALALLHDEVKSQFDSVAAIDKLRLSDLVKNLVNRVEPAQLNGTIRDVINEICLKLDQFRVNPDLIENHGQLERWFYRAQELTLAILGPLTTWRARPSDGHALFESQKVSVGTLAIMLQIEHGGILKVAYVNNDAQMGHEMVNYPTIIRIPKFAPNGVNTLCKDSLLVSLYEEVTRGCAEQKDSLSKSELFSLTHQLNFELAGKSTADNRPFTVGLFHHEAYPIPDLLRVLHEVYLALDGCPLVLLSDVKADQSFFIDPGIINVQLGFLWKKQHEVRTAVEASFHKRIDGVNMNNIIGSLTVVGTNNSGPISTVNASGKGKAKVTVTQQTLQITDTEQLIQHVQHLVTEMSAGLPGLSEKTKTQWSSHASDLETLIAEPKKNVDRIKSILESVKTAAEYVATGETVVKYATLALGLIGVIV